MSSITDDTRVDSRYTRPFQHHHVSKLSDSHFMYRDYQVQYEPPPVPSRDYDWCFAHDDFDGAPDSGDARCGYAKSADDCFTAIDEIYNDN